VSEHDRDPACGRTAAGAQLRIARPTDRIDLFVGMYRDGLGLSTLSAFEDHDGY